jgi:hypothetical protein
MIASTSYALQLDVFMDILIGLDITFTPPPHSFIIHGMINEIKLLVLKLKLKSKHQTFSCKLSFSFTVRQ